jgi:hypothetical protein
MKKISLLILAILLFSCEKEEAPLPMVRFYTTTSRVTIFADFAYFGFDIKYGSRYRPDCSEVTEPDKDFTIKSFRLKYGTYKVHYHVLDCNIEGDGEFTVDQDCIRLDCGFIPGWKSLKN